MSLALHQLGIDLLSFEDRLALVHDIWDSIAVEAEKIPLVAGRSVWSDGWVRFVSGVSAGADWVRLYAWLRLVERAG